MMLSALLPKGASAAGCAPSKSLAGAEGAPSPGDQWLQETLSHHYVVRLL